MSPKTIFFDLDETLIVNQLGADELLLEVYVAQLGEPEPEELRSFQKSILESASTVWAQMFEANGNGYQVIVESFQAAITNPNKVALGKEMAQHFLERASTATELSDNALHVLEEIKCQGIATGLITNGFTELQTAKLDRHGLKEFLDVVIISEQAGAHKPDGRIFEYALRKANSTANSSWHVGDHKVNDIQGAKDAGFTTVLFRPEDKAEQNLANAKAVECDHRISDLAELLPLL